MNRKILFPIAILLGLTLAPVRSDPAADYPPIKLRAYGTLSGSYSASPIEGRPASVLTITCDNEDKAKLVVAKYLSLTRPVYGEKGAYRVLNIIQELEKYNAKDLMSLL